MSARSRLFAAAFSLTLASALPAVSYAQDQIPDEVENAKFNFSGIINANAVYVRSGPGDNYYPTLKLDKGAKVTVVGIKFDWLKITPPEGSFCYVAKAYVEKRGDGSVGRVTKPDLNVRAGSSLNAMKATVQTRLDQNQDVKILGEVDEYFKIEPPANAYLYVSKQFVDPGEKVEPIAENATPTDVAANTSTPVQAPQDATAAVAEASEPIASEPIAAAPSTQPAENAAEVAEATTPSTQPVALKGEALFDKLEADFTAAGNQPLADQPIDEMLTGFESLATGNELPESMRRIAEHRVATLKIRKDAREQLLTVRKAQEELAQRQMVFQAEQEELNERIKQHDVKLFTAVGTLQTSSLQQGAQTLYRLTDPANGRTVLYIRSNDVKFATMLGQFIGVTGDVVIDQQLKVITPATVEQVDQSKVNTSVMATITPPSLAGRSTASTSE